MRISMCTNYELVSAVKTALQTVKEKLLVLISTVKNAELLKEAKEAIEELEKREKEKLAVFQNMDFRHVEKIGNKLYLIEVDCGAVEATGIIQVRLEEYENEEALEGGFNYQLLGIFDSIDEAVIALEKIKREAQVLQRLSGR